MSGRTGWPLVVFALTMWVGISPAGAAPGDENWPQWRGPLGTGVAPSGDPPTTWAEGKNVKWKVKIPGRGTATPIIWGDSIYIQTAIAMDPKDQAAEGQGGAAARPPATQPAAGGQPQRGGGPGGPPGGPGGRPGRGGGGGGGGFGGSVVTPTGPYQFVLMCLDRKTGAPKWQKVAAEVIPHEGHHKDHGFSSSSPITDGQHIYAYFGSRGLHCYDMDGNLKWEKDLGKMQTRNGFGEGSSPALHGDTIVINWDHEGDDFIVAFDKKTGNELWRQPRNEDQTWATPLIVEYNGQAQVIQASAKKVRSYDLKTGKPIWESPGLTPNPIPTPVSSNDMVYITSGFRGAALFAIKLGGTGDLTGTESIVWSGKRGTPYVPSPMLYGDRLYFFSGNNGILTCYDVKTGKPIIETERIDDIENVYASPVGAGGRVYMVGRNGTTVVIKNMDASNKVEELAVNKLDERIDASPAIVGKELYLRGQESLYCISQD